MTSSFFMPFAFVIQYYLKLKLSGREIPHRAHFPQVVSEILVKTVNQVNIKKQNGRVGSSS